LRRFLVSQRGIFWLLTLIWAAQIYRFSTAPYSSEASRSVLERVLQTLHLTVSSSAISALNTLGRKLTHLTEYCILTLLLYRSISPASPLRWRPCLAYFSVGLASLYAIGDEYHQLFVPGRRAALLDWGIDLVGAGVAALVVYICFPDFSTE
jgi:VanZ family protein